MHFTGVQEFSMFDPDLLRSIGFLPNEYLYYYYHREKALENIKNQVQPEERPSRTLIFR